MVCLRARQRSSGCDLPRQSADGWLSAFSVCWASRADGPGVAGGKWRSDSHQHIPRSSGRLCDVAGADCGTSAARSDMVQRTSGEDSPLVAYKSVSLTYTIVTYTV